MFDRESGTLFYIYMLSALISEGVIMATISLYIVEIYGNELAIGAIAIQAATAGGAALAFRSTVSALFSPWIGRLTDQIQNSWIGIWVANLFGVAGLCTLALIHHPISIVFGLFMIAINSGIILTGTPAILTRMNSTKKSILIGWMATSVDVGLTLAPLISYLLLGTIPLQNLYLFGAGLAACSFPVITYYANDARKRHTARITPA